MAKSLEDRPGTVPSPAGKRGIGRVLLDALAEGILNVILFVFLFGWWLARWSAATVFFLAVMAGAGYYVFNEALRGGTYVEVPDITMRPITEAAALLAEKGLEVGRQRTAPDERVPKYYVLTQSPAPGKVVRTGRKVSLTVSQGTQSLTPPNLIGRVVENPEEELKRTSFVLGTVARLPHSSPRDTVLAQDPGPARLVSASTRISLLLSEGPPRRLFQMPELMGKPVQEVLKLLAPLGVKPTPNEVNMPGQPVDVVLDQQPPAGSWIQEGARVVYSVYPSGAVSLPDARREVQVTYTVPPSWFERQVRIDAIDRNGIRTTVFPRERDYVDGEPPRWPSGTKITTQSLSFIDKMTVEVYLDQRLAKSLFYEGDKPPVVNEYNVQ